MSQTEKRGMAHGVTKNPAHLFTVEYMHLFLFAAGIPVTFRTKQGLAHCSKDIVHLYVYVAWFF